MNIVFDKLSSRIVKGGGLWFVTPYNSAKKIGDNWLSIVNAAAASGVTSLSILDSTGFPATGELTVGSETGVAFSAVTNNTITCTTTSAAHGVGEVLFVTTTDSYTTFDKLGWSEMTVIDPGIPEAENVTDENDVVARSFSGAAKPMVTITMQQGLINEMALYFNKDVETTKVNGSYAVADTDISDLAAFYIVERTDGKFLVFKFARLAKSGSNPITFNNELNTVDVVYNVVTGEGDNWDMRIYGEE